MEYGAIVRKPPAGWRHAGWRACTDLHEGDVTGVPRWFRCLRCNSLVTHGMIKGGGCFCGNRRLQGAHELSWWEILRLKVGRFPLDAREAAAVRPLWGAP